MSINGYSNDSNVSVIDLAGKTGFELANENTTININNATLTDSVSASTNPIIDVQTANNVINLNNAQLNGNIVSSTNSYQLNFYGSNVGINGTVDKANAILDNAATTLTFKANTFANANLSAVAGTINLQDSAIDNYNIGTLTSDTNALYNMIAKFTAQINNNKLAINRKTKTNGGTSVQKPHKSSSIFIYSFINLCTETISFILSTLLPQNIKASFIFPFTAFISAFVIQYGVFTTLQVFIQL